MVKKAARKRPVLHLRSQKKIKQHLSTQTKFGLRLGLGFLLFIFLLFLIKSIFLSITHSIWDGKNQLIIAYEFNQALGLVKIDPALNEIAIVSFPDDMYIPLALGYQSYRVNKVKALADQENISMGKILTASITQSIGVLTDSYIIKGKGKTFDIKNLIWQSILNPNNSNLTAWDKMRLVIFVNSLKINELKQYKAEEEFLQSLILPDGSEVLVINENVLTTFVLQELANSSFLQEKLTWELYNATNHDGLANAMRRIVANSGFDVSGIRQALENRESSTLYVSDWNKVNESVKRFANFFKFTIVVDSDYTQRSDIALYLGED